MNQTHDTTPEPPRGMKLALGGSAILALASAGVFYYAAVNRHVTGRDSTTRIEIGATSCNPANLQLAAGLHHFEIVNTTARTAEWEILDGDMVIEEREHMLPGFTYKLSTTLKPGAYKVICGLLSNPRGALTVIETAQSQSAAAAGPPLKAFLGPLSEYKVFLVMQSAGLVTATQTLAEAIRQGDLPRARNLYVEARVPYRKIEAAIGQWSDLKNAIDPAADYLAGREADPAFTGFHRLEFGLFAEASTVGLASIADKLAIDVGELNTRLRALRLTPSDLLRPYVRLLHGLADGKIENGEDAYSHGDLADLDASLAGLEKIAALVRPLVPAASSDLAGTLDARLKTTRQALAAMKSAEGYPSYARVEKVQRQKISNAFRDLADTLDEISGKLIAG